MLRLVVVAALVGLPGQAHALERPRPMGLYASSGPALAMVDSRIELTVRGPIIETIVVQRFRNATDRVTEATYIFPLPADAAVSAMSMQIGTRTIHAAIERREAAQRRYEAAVAAGAPAALLDQERPDVFTQTVSAIPVGGVVEITLRYDTLARYEAGTWQLVVPMVVAPRYVPGTASGRATTGSGRAADTDRAPDASRVTPAASPGAGGSTAVAIHFVDPPSELSSPTHEIRELGARRDATLSDPHSDHDAIVRWRAPAASAGWVERDGDAGFAAVVVEAPPSAPHQRAVRVILALDRAATTRGDGDAVAHPLVRALLGALTAADRVRVIGNDTTGPTAWIAPADAVRALERAWSSPPRNFDLTRVLATARPDGAALVLISDGLVADDPAAIAAAAALGVPVHIVGIGPAPARATLHRIASASGGTLRYAVPGDDVTAVARGVVADLASLPAPLTVNWGTLAASDVEPAVLPRLGAGQAMLVLARIKHPQVANARVRGELFAFEALAPARVVDGATTAHGPLARRWARERLGDLLAGPAERNAVISHALGYGLVSPYTSLVAIGNDVVVEGGVKRSVAVPVSLPAGMQWHAVKQATELDTSGAPAEPPHGATKASVTQGNGIVDAKPAAADPVEDKRDVAKARKPAKEPSDDDTPRKRGFRDDKTKRRGDGEKTPRANDDSDDDRHHADADQAKPAAHDRPKTDDDVRPPRTKRVPPSADQAVAPGAPAAVAPPPVVALAAPEPAAEAEATETITVGHSRPLGSWRVTAALGGGLAFDRGARGLLALDARIEAMASHQLGVEAALWLAQRADAQGRVLVGAARSALAGHLELGVGLGLQFGDGIGPAGALRLRVNTPLPWLASYLRYDAALLLTRPTRDADHAITFGLELSY